jgi:hypothetical protein
MVTNYDVLVLGASGSGKTVFLASMDSKLSVQNRDVGFFLSVPLKQRRLLAQKFAEVAYGAEWPAGTREISEWLFTCNVFAPNSATFPVCEFTYTDYAGGLVTDPNESDELQAKVDSADALLGIIDGHKLNAELDDTVVAPPGTRVWQDLDIIIPELAPQEGSVPVHFIISKWDLLHDKYTLAEVRDRLLEHNGFSNLVESRVDRQIPVRLIPVSSVGMGFAELQDGVMKKIPNAVPKPFQVEMPICHVLMDKLKTEIETLRNKESEIMSQSVPAPTAQVGFWASLKAAGAGLVQSLVEDFLPAKYQYASPIISKAISYLEAEQREAEEAARARSERLGRERDESLRQVQDQATAMKSTMDSFMYQMSKLSRDFPESDLSRR